MHKALWDPDPPPAGILLFARKESFLFSKKKKRWQRNISFLYALVKRIRQAVILVSLTSTIMENYKDWCSLQFILLHKFVQDESSLLKYIFPKTSLYIKWFLFLSLPHQIDNRLCRKVLKNTKRRSWSNSNCHGNILDFSRSSVLFS